MPGLRIYHPTLRSAVVRVPCPAKTPMGSPKQVPIVVDDQGCALVSQGVWDELMLAESIGHRHQFIILNEVPNPPRQIIGEGPHERDRPTYQLEREALRQIAPAGVSARVVQGLPARLN